ncbi:TonB family protein [Bradyrhizobium sp. 2TAF24]|uniref:TonB family protein n=1 Tax=Bradyrhizobium sp. 2TAF24 TaxID=3233011 RepID=UPI003F919D70
MSGPAQAQADSNIPPLEFNIPSQPLEAALGRYGDATGREALYDTSIAIGRMSGEVRGVLTPNEALARLLSGTGLSPRFVADNSFVLLPTPGIAATDARSSPPSHRRYYGIIQQDLLSALCRSGARPGHYRVAAVFWIDPAGKVEKAQLIGPAGSAGVDQQIEATLRAITFRAPPPAGFAQPVLVLIVPQIVGVTPGCGQTASDLPPIGGGR